jgi:hypothetical protein
MFYMVVIVLGGIELVYEAEDKSTIRLVNV